MAGVFNIFGSRHNSERTVVAFDSLNSRILTASTDGKIRVYNDKDDPNPIESIVGENVNCLMCKDDDVIVGTESSNVYIQNIEEGLLVGVATRFTAGVSCLALSKDHSHLLAGSSDFTLKLIDLTGQDDASREVLIRGHDGPILSVDMDPLETFAASSSCDGTVRVWRLSDGLEVKKLFILPKFADVESATSRCKLKFEPTQGEYLAIPVGNVVQLYSRNEWKICRILEPSISSAITELEFSPNFVHLVGLSSDGCLTIWNPEDKTILTTINSNALSNVCCLIWPQMHTIFCTDIFGAVGYVDIDIRSLQTDHASSEIFANTALTTEEITELFSNADPEVLDDLAQVAANQAREEKAKSAAAASFATTTEQDDTESHKGRHGQRLNFSDDDDVDNIRLEDDDDDDDDPNTVALSKIKSSFMKTLDLSDEEEEDGEGKPKQIEKVVVESTAPTRSIVEEKIRSFQPGSSPEGFRERFLVWNHVGVVIRFENEVDEEDTVDASIEVEFHDTTFHHTIHLKTGDFTMADLSTTALMLASAGSSEAPAEDSEEQAPNEADLSTIVIRPLGTGDLGSDTNSDWSARLPKGEVCRSVCLLPGDDCGSNGLAVVATSLRLLRFFLQPSSSASGSGGVLQLMQATPLGLPPISLPGKDIVTMASHPTLPILAVVIGWSNEDLYWRVYHLSTNHGAPKGWLLGRLSSTFYPLPISPSAHLSWLGFSDAGNLYTHDSVGSLRRLTHQGATDFHWIQTCDTRKCIKSRARSTDCFFIVGVTENAYQPLGGMKMNKNLLDDEEEYVDNNFQKAREDELGFGQVQAIYCKASRWPRPVPRPIVSTLPFRLPLCGVLQNDQGSLEENYLRTMVLDQKPFWGVPDEDLAENLENDRLKARRKTLLRLFAMAAKLESDWAALALVYMMPDVATVRYAIRYAANVNRQGLAQKVGQIALEMEEQEERQQAVRQQVQAESAEESSVDYEKENEEESQQSGEEVGDGDGDDVAEILGDDDDDDNVNDENTDGDHIDHNTEDYSFDLPSEITNSTSPPTQSLDTSRATRFNPFRRNSNDEPKQQIGGRGSCALDKLKPPPPKSTQSAKRNMPAQGRKPAATKVPNKTVCKPRETVKRPASDFPQRAAKRLSTFEFHQKQ
ncbi:unnamed protein product [Rodentolepis nana]|uniref:Mcl1_mid domain-containing protein n=1 Tax=Rodentolepis nana TaxID=102285 RepID=A0A0R3TNU6_RODNA|nr:unnamed protein product [Rodentolepis nana]